MRSARHPAWLAALSISIAGLISTGAAAQSGDVMDDEGVPPIKSVRDPLPPPNAVLDDDALDDERDDADATDDVDEGAFTDTGQDDERDGREESGEHIEPYEEDDTGWDDDVPPLDSPFAPRPVQQAFIHPTLPAVAPRESWSVAAGIQLDNSLATTLVVEARPAADLWLMVRGSAGVQQSTTQNESFIPGPPAFTTTTDFSRIAANATAGLGARYGFRLADRVEVSPVAWVRGGFNLSESETASVVSGGPIPGAPNVATESQSGFFGSASLGAAAEVFFIDNLSLRLSADVVETLMRASVFTTASGANQNVLGDFGLTDIGLRLLPRAGFSLRILF